ncbi:hypothetical protein [Lysobacter fragariae]
MNATRIIAAVVAIACAPVVNAKECRNIHADVVEVYADHGCTLAGTCFIGEFKGNGFSGVNEFALDGSNAGPASSSDFISYAGPFEYTTAKGTLKVRETGVYNVGTGQPQSGAVAGYQQIVGGTGEFAGATGQLYSRGRAANGVFNTQVTGQVCVP